MELAKQEEFATSSLRALDKGAHALMENLIGDRFQFEMMDRLAALILFMARPSLGERDQDTKSTRVVHLSSEVECEAFDHTPSSERGILGDDAAVELVDFGPPERQPDDPTVRCRPN